jgi:hypothetical protein
MNKIGQSVANQSSDYRCAQGASIRFAVIARSLTISFVPHFGGTLSHVGHRVGRLPV